MVAQTFLQAPDGRGHREVLLGHPGTLDVSKPPTRPVQWGRSRLPQRYHRVPFPTTSSAVILASGSQGTLWLLTTPQPLPTPGSGDSASDTGRGLGSSRGPRTPSHPRGQEVSRFQAARGGEEAGGRWQGRRKWPRQNEDRMGDCSPPPGAVIKPPSLLGSEMRHGSEMSRDGHTLLLGLGLCHQ